MKVNIANAITMSRLALAIVFAVLLLADAPSILVVACFILAAASDWIDGFLARRFRQATKYGALLDQVIDRIFTVVVVTSLVIHTLVHPDGALTFHWLGWDPWWLLLLTCSREICSFPALVIAYLRHKRLYNVEYIGKVTTFLQSVTLGALIIGVSWAPYLVIATGAIGILAAASYTRYALRAQPGVGTPPQPVSP